MTAVKEFNQYKVTNATIRFLNSSRLSNAEKLGCTGKLEYETELKTVVKECEGAVSKQWSVPVKITGTFTGHIPVDVLRKVYGLTNNQLVEGVYGYSTSSVGGTGAMMFETLDITETLKKYVAFPNMSFSAGLNASIENGGDEIAQIEIPFVAMKDENNFFYYEAFDSELGSDSKQLKTKWFTQFDSTLVKQG